jgi:pSer/pThr/pTyr-binding forkhead associated (FHA) protein
LKPPVFLRIYLNGKLETVKQFTEQQIVIGRNDDIQVPLKDESVSPLHAVIEERDAGYYVSDLGSQLGTLKNGQKAFDEALQSGDELHIGPYKIEFFVGVPKPTAAPKGSDVVTPLEKSKPKDTPPPISEKKKKDAPPPAATASAPSAPYKAAKPAVIAPPPGNVSDLTRALKKSRGTLVEVVVAWKERVIATHHYRDKGEITMGSAEDCGIVIPLLGVSRSKHTLLKIDATVRVCLTAEMTGEYFKDDEHLSLAELKRKNRITQVESGFEFDLAQGETIRLGLHGDLLSIYIRYVQETPAPVIGPLFDLTASESTAVLMSFVIAAIFGLYMLIYSPKPLADETKLEEPLRKATVTFNPP